MDPNKWVKIHVVENIFEMDMIRDALDKEGIRHTIKEYRDTAYDGIFILQKGYASFSVMECDKDRALIIKRIKSLPYVAHSKD